MSKLLIRTLDVHDPGQLEASIDLIERAFADPNRYDRDRITRDWGVHLTGVGDLPPRATRRGSLHTGRMSSLVRRHGRNRLWAPVYNKVLVAHRPMGDSKLEDPVEQHPAAT